MSVYEKDKLINVNNIKSHALAILVDNQAGALARVVGMFSAHRILSSTGLTLASLNQNLKLS